MGKREKPQPASWKSQLSPPSSHLSIVIAYFFYRCTRPYALLRIPLCLPPETLRNCDSGSPMNNDRSSGGSSNGTTPPSSAGNDHEVDPPPPSPTFGGHLDAEVSIAYFFYSRASLSELHRHVSTRNLITAILSAQFPLSLNDDSRTAFGRVMLVGGEHV
jgi:hypothetical protein